MAVVAGASPGGERAVTVPAVAGPGDLGDALHDPGGCAVTNGWRVCVRFDASLCDAARDLGEFAGTL